MCTSCEIHIHNRNILYTVDAYQHMSAASLSASKPSSSKRQRRKRRKRDPTRPKKPQSAFLLFAADKRDSIRTKYPDASLPERSKKLGELWKTLSASDKEPYESRAAVLKESYTKAIAEWTAQQPPKIKRARSAYAFFMKDVRASLAAKFPDKNPRQLMSDVAAAWQNAEESTKNKYKQLAEEDKQRYKRETSAGI